MESESLAGVRNVREREGYLDQRLCVCVCVCVCVCGGVNSMGTECVSDVLGGGTGVSGTTPGVQM